MRKEEESGAGTAPKKSSLGSFLWKRPATTTTVDGEENPLTGWKNNQGGFPLMARLALKYLCICATSAPSERVFSTAGSVATPLRSLLNPEKVNMLVFLARNLDI